MARFRSLLSRALGWTSGRRRPSFDDVLRETRFARDPLSIRVSTLERALSDGLPRTQPPTRGQ